MKIYALNYLDTDGCTYSCLFPCKLYSKKEDAETELTRLELIHLEAIEKHKTLSAEEYYKWCFSLPDDDRDATRVDDRGFRFSIEEMEVL